MYDVLRETPHAPNLVPRDLAPGREPVDRVALESQDLGYFVDGVALAQILDRTGCPSQRTAANCFVRVRFTIKELVEHITEPVQSSTKILLRCF